MRLAPGALLAAVLLAGCGSAGVAQLPPAAGPPRDVAALAGGRSVVLLGVPTIADRVAQTVVAMHLEQRADHRFHPDSYGYRPGKSAHDALAACRQRCWKDDWVIDLDDRTCIHSPPVPTTDFRKGDEHRI